MCVCVLLIQTLVSVERQTGEVVLISGLDYDSPTNRDHAISIRAEVSRLALPT